MPRVLPSIRPPSARILFSGPLLTGRRRPLRQRRTVARRAVSRTSLRTRRSSVGFVLESTLRPGVRSRIRWRPSTSLGLLVRRAMVRTKVLVDWVLAVAVMCRLISGRVLRAVEKEWLASTRRMIWRLSELQTFVSPSCLLRIWTGAPFFAPPSPSFNFFFLLSFFLGLCQDG